MTDPGERNLWQAVLIRALQDAVWVDQKPTGKHTGNVLWFGKYVARQTAHRMRDEAVFWLLTDNRDFVYVCDMAGFTPSVVRQGAQRMLEASDERKIHWYTHGLQVSDLWGLGDARPERVTS
jgi:hypothetical protein